MGAVGTTVEAEQVLAANEAFYRAFATGDATAMEALWAHQAPTTCIHPGWAALTSRDDIIKSWRGILQAPPPIRCRNARAFVYGNTASVICEEIILDGVLLTTNLFVHEDGTWRIAHHHATQITVIDAEVEDEDDIGDDDEDDEAGNSGLLH